MKMMRDYSLVNKEDDQRAINQRHATVITVHSKRRCRRVRVLLNKLNVL